MFRTLREMMRVRTHLADLASARSTVEAQSQLIAEQKQQLADAAHADELKSRMIDEQAHRLADTSQRLADTQQHRAEALRVLDEKTELVAQQTRLIEQNRDAIHNQVSPNSQLEHLNVLLSHIEKRIFSPDAVAELSPHFKRNLLPNDDAATQKTLVAFWAAGSKSLLDYRDILESGFRVFSQNDEDGALLRIFSKIGTTNRFVLEIGSNCSGSDIGIPENLSTNLIINHGWHGVIVELDAVECEKMRYFFSRNLATKHFHMSEEGEHTYFSPSILQREVTPGNIDALFAEANAPAEPDLFTIDIDGGDYAVVEQLSTVRPRVVVVEFEKRFRDRFSVFQPDRANFSQRFPQSGTVSLKAWETLLGSRGYMLVAIATCGFNAYFVRTDIADGRFSRLDVTAAFDQHPLLGRAPASLWLEPDETWATV